MVASAEMMIKIGDNDDDDDVSSGDSDTVFDTVVFTWNLLKSINLFKFDFVCLLIECYTFKCHNSGASNIATVAAQLAARRI